MPVQIGELINASELAIYGQVQQGQLIAGGCGVRYIVKVQESYKGSRKIGTALLFSSPEPLIVGSNYVLFLGKDNAAFEPLASTNTFGLRPSPEKARICARNRPRYTVNLWGLGALKVTGTYQSKTRFAVFDGFMIRMPNAVRIKKLDPQSRYDIDRTSDGVEFDALRRMLKGKPATGQAPGNSFKPKPLRRSV